MKTVVVRIRRDGSVEAETVGITGPECLDYIPVIERLTQARTVESHFKPEFHAEQQTHVSDHVVPEQRLTERDEL